MAKPKPIHTSKLIVFRFLLLTLMLTLSPKSYGQSQETPIGDSIVLTGMILEEGKYPVIGCMIQFNDSVNSKIGAVSDFNGNFKLTISSSCFNTNNAFLFFKSARLLPTKVDLEGLDITQKIIVHMLTDFSAGCEFPSYRVPLINKFNPGTNKTYKNDEIEKMPH